MTDVSQPQPQQQFRIINPKNVFITKDNVEVILRKYGVEHEVNDIKLWQQAFAHPSYCVNGGGKKRYQLQNAGIINGEEEDDSSTASTTESADVSTAPVLSVQPCEEGIVPLQLVSLDRLEFRGDARLGDVVTDYLMKRYKKQDEGFLTKLRSKIVRKEKLAFLSRELNLNTYLLISDYLEITANGRDNDNNLEDIFEAFIGALSYETDWATCYTFIVNVLQAHIDFSALIQEDNNYKDILMRHYQHKFNGATPKYEVDIDPTTGRPAGPPFTAYVMCPEGKRRFASGTGKKRQQAEQEAAKNAYLKMNA